jgi:hypothetical protein
VRRRDACLCGIACAAIAACASAQYTGAATGPTLTLPAHIAEGTPQHARPLTQPDGGANPPPAPADTALPDPEPLRLERQWDYELMYDRGRVRVLGVQERTFPKPIVTARRMGRFAIELWIGGELIDRVRFDFPLLPAETLHSGPRHPLHEPPSFAEGLVARRHVLVPASPRATRAVLVDRATGKSRFLPWPPDHPLASPEQSMKDAPAAAPPSDAGAPSDGGSR